LFVQNGAQQGDERPVLEATASGIGQTEGKLTIKDGDGNPITPAGESDNHNYQSQAEALAKVAESIAQHSDDRPVAIGHRIVHGGMHLTRHQKITPALLVQLEQAVHFAPLHIPGSLELIRKAADLYPSTPQFACFDTAFHQTLPEQAWRVPIPEAWAVKGVRRYGFHGLSYESIVAQLRAEGRVPERMIVAHLGSGSSICAIERGRSVDTSMGLTPTGGVPMASRTGDLDPGVLIFLMRSGGLNLDQIELLVNHDSGLRALSGGISDMQMLEAAAETSDRRASLAITIFAQAVAKTIAGYIVSLAGLDLLVFTGGIGEHSAGFRREVCEALRPLGIRLEASANQGHTGLISDGRSQVPIRVLPAEEDLQIARHSRRLLEI
jgi:acetate kinase